MTTPALDERSREVLRQLIDLHILTGEPPVFCAGADLKAIGTNRTNRVDPDVDVDGPMGPSRMTFSKPVIERTRSSCTSNGSEVLIPFG